MECIVVATSSKVVTILKELVKRSKSTTKYDGERWIRINNIHLQTIQTIQAKHVDLSSQDMSSL